jgi:two-component system, NarL family, response regulator DevR
VRGERVVHGRKAVLLDQHPLWHEAVQPVLDRLEIEVIAKTTSAQDALSVIEERRPDLFLLELDLPEDSLDGIGLIREAKERDADLRVIVLSLYDNPHEVEAAFAAGAGAYVLKSVLPEDLATAVRQAFEPSIYLPGSKPAARGADRSKLLTERELEIVRLVGEGHSNRELARMLWVTEQTVKFHLTNIYRKLGVSNRTEASRWAQAQGLLSGSPAQRLRTVEPAARSYSTTAATTGSSPAG